MTNIPNDPIKDTVRINEIATQVNQIALESIDNNLGLLMKTFFECSSYEWLQKAEEVLRKNLTALIEYKNAVNKKYLDKEIVFNPELGVVIKKMTEPPVAPENRSIKEGSVPPKPRFEI